MQHVCSVCAVQHALLRAAAGAGGGLRSCSHALVHRSAVSWVLDTVCGRVD